MVLFHRKRGIAAQYLDTNSELILVTLNLYVVSNRDMAFPNPRRLSPKLKFNYVKYVKGPYGSLIFLAVKPHKKM